MTNLNLGLLLKYYRARHKLMQKQLAQKLNISAAQMSKLESGAHKPYGDIQLRILTLLVPELESSLLQLELEVEQNMKEIK